MERAPEADDPHAPTVDATRRTWLAAERTWLAWWRTGLGAAALAITVGRILPRLGGGARWPYLVLGIGYSLLAMAVLVVGVVRQQGVAESLREGGYRPLSNALVVGLTGVALALALATLALIIAGL